MIAGRNNNIVNVPPIEELKKKSSTIVRLDDGIIKMKDYITGHEWSVNYYRQSTGIEDVNMQLDQGSQVASQHYIKYNNLSVNLSEPLDTSNINTLNGVLTITKLVPQSNDFLTANLPTGEIGIFRVTEVKAVNYSLDTIYEVSFTIDTTSTIDPNRLASLEDSVVKNYFYNRNSLYSQSDSLLIESDAELVKQLERYIDVNVNEYIKDYSNTVLSLDDGTSIFYSPEIDKLTRNIFNSKELENIDSRISEKDYMSDFLLGYAPYKDLYFVIDENSFEDNQDIEIAFRLRKMYPSDIDYIVKISKNLNSESNLPTFSSFLYDGTNTNPYFLYNKNSLAPFQLLLRKYLSEESISNLDMINLMNEEFTFTDRYYFMPLIIMVMKYKLNILYS